MSRCFFSANDYQQRRRGVLRRVQADHKVSALLVTDRTDVRYLSGAVEGVSALLFARDWAVVYTNKMFIDWVRGQTPGADAVIPHGPLFEQIQRDLNRRKHRSGIGFQGNHMTVTRHATLLKAMPRRRLVDVGAAVVDYRAVKDEQEIRLTRKCVRMAEKAFLSLITEGIHAFLGHSEKRLAAELEYRMRQLGADRQAFPDNGIIVAGGANSASCHHEPTDRKVRRGEPLLFDWGAELNGYRSDITRVIFLGAPRPKLAEIYDLVLRANRAGVAALAPGVATHTVARRAWDVIRDGGYADTIRHGLGHGLGLNIHEAPRIGNGNSAQTPSVRLRTNMLVTVEPGIYLKGLGGIRIEDDVRITPRGHECLTRFPRRIEDVILG
ncbi:MAG: Xaa-Pro peptidase family protein [Kiritimatiellia bacterium]|jgi:Xaa-Pro aminopeptidase|nr:Xaa-Pro peptidase family protein [Kiritimatiellia bacterium]MDP6811211.1 Xaa-Pro peptidase family protein [Kiritimatiellia bacterium]MDP7024344.1 Xaa-Pro peptidase family protein [Kiritimatiellia bacterium]